MGSLASRPKAPKIQQRPVILTVPQTTAYSAPTPVTVSQTVVSSSMPEAPRDEDIQAQARSAGLLDRRRGVLSTVLTGFRGLLTQAADGAQKKSLLGE